MTRIKDPMTGEVREKRVTAFSEQEPLTPLVSASSYSKHVNEKRKMMAEAKSHKVPLGHAPPIPEGKLAPLANALAASKLPAPDFGPQEESDTPQVSYKIPKDVPPAPMPGIGAAYPVNQAIARGEFDRPVTMKEAQEYTQNEMAKRMEARAVSDETKKLLQSQHGGAKESPTTPSSKEALDSVEEELAERKDEDALTFDFEALRRASIPLLNSARRKAIEANLAPMNFEDLITKREITENVPIIPGKFVVGYRTVREKEHIWVLQYVYESPGVSSASYIEEFGNICRLVCGVQSLNGRPLPDHRNNTGQYNEEVDKEKFKKKLDILMGYPTHIVADIAINYNWFSERVTSLFSVENLKNG